MSKSLALKPHLSEKTYGLSQERNTYSFKVPATATKLTIAKAVSDQYSVSVTGVRVAGVPGKTKRSYRRGGRVVHRGQSSSARKAYVTLKDGDKLPIYAAVEDATKDEGEAK